MKRIQGTLRAEIKERYGSLNNYLVQENAVERGNLNRFYLTDILTGIRLPTEQQAKFLAKVVNKPAEELFGDDYTEFKVI